MAIDHLISSFLTNSIQQVRKPDKVLKEALRVGEKAINRKKQKIAIENTHYMNGNSRIRVLPNLFAQAGIFVLRQNI